MTTRLRTAVVRRPSLPLTEQDDQDLAVLRESEPHRAALERLSGRTVAGVSEAALLHAVFEVGLSAVRSAIEDAAYAALAAQQASEELSRKGEARRRRPGWSNDA